MQCWCEFGEDPKSERGSQSRVEGEGVSGRGRGEGETVTGIASDLRRRQHAKEKEGGKQSRITWHRGLSCAEARRGD